LRKIGRQGDDAGLLGCWVAGTRRFRIDTVASDNEDAHGGVPMLIVAGVSIKPRIAKALHSVLCHVRSEYLPEVRTDDKSILCR
jgi:hypothetical protein